MTPFTMQGAVSRSRERAGKRDHPSDMQPAENPGIPGASRIALVYALYLGGLMTIFTAPLGVALAYGFRRTAPEPQQAHHIFQIRTFWLGLVILLPGLFLAANLVGYALISAWMIWAVGRCGAGLHDLMYGRPVPAPYSLGFGRAPRTGDPGPGP